MAAPVASGSPQPVWFRVVRRDGEPVAKAVVALLDDRGREVDTTKTAPDGGGELHTPHGGRFLMIVSADGYQPRAATLTVDEQPVELALLLPRSAAVAGSVRAGGVAVRAALVVVRQDHDVVDEALTAGDGRYRFDDLAEGSYTVAATGGAGSRGGPDQHRRGGRRGGRPRPGPAAVRALTTWSTSTGGSPASRASSCTGRAGCPTPPRAECC